MFSINQGPFTEDECIELETKGERYQSWSTIGKYTTLLLIIAPLVSVLFSQQIMTAISQSFGIVGIFRAIGIYGILFSIISFLGTITIAVWIFFGSMAKQYRYIQYGELGPEYGPIFRSEEYLAIKQQQNGKVFRFQIEALNQ